LRFDLALGETGGEDTFFFFECMRAGAAFGYAPDAVVTEFTAMSRANLKWLLLRRFRSGQTHSLILRRQGKVVTGALSAIGKMGFAVVAALVSAPRPPRAAAHLLRGALHAGVIASAMGGSAY